MVHSLTVTLVAVKWYRGVVTMTQPFMLAYSQLVIKTCHRRGVHAMGGMAAQIPIKTNKEANDAAMEKVGEGASTTGLATISKQHSSPSGIQRFAAGICIAITLIFACGAFLRMIVRLPLRLVYVIFWHSNRKRAVPALAYSSTASMVWGKISGTTRALNVHQDDVALYSAAVFSSAQCFCCPNAIPGC